MNIFGWKSSTRTPSRAPKSPVPLARSFGGLASGQWAQNYEGQVREGYLSNAIAQRAVRLVAEGVASVAIKGNDPKVLAMLRATSAGQNLAETVAAQMLLHGNAYIEIIVGDDGAPAELFALRPERVTIEADRSGWPQSFLYRVGEATSRLPGEAVIHIRSMHPLDDHYGLGCLGAASGAIAIHNAAAKWNKALLDNAARPSGALSYEQSDGAVMTPEQFDRLKTELEDAYQGAGNAGRPMLLDGGLKWQAMALTPAEMDFAGLKASAAREIALAFGVPPMLLGLPGDATYANYREANKALWRQAIIPLASRIYAAIAERLRLWWPELALSIDLDTLPALADEREALWAQIGAADFLTGEEKKMLVGINASPLQETQNS